MSPPRAAFTAGVTIINFSSIFFDLLAESAAISPGQLQTMCDRCSIFDRKIQRFKELVVQLSDFDDGLVEQIMWRIARLRRMKAALHPEDR
ncbi:hypothetical protein [Bradyrhizobium iriomotense]|uniref:hypothetical protein n=1 Tax=Bradyrhizobium iriomotense TaxID=441950 RepID=UPI001B8A52BD|nr:hypothetical protein [Bradyrhizobium iriomotense]MBR1132121.1 hypothetical protein [Bradyrhizobium iriomotense]